VGERERREGERESAANGLGQVAEQTGKRQGGEKRDLMGVSKARNQALRRGLVNRSG
jgi:hypothetical protein